MSRYSPVNSSPSRTRWIAQSALFLALALILPAGLHAFGIGGRVFLPMHIPVLLAGMIIGPVSGLVVGLLAPALGHLMTGMPPSYAVPLMSLELPIYGLIAGLAYKRLKLNVYISLLAAMLFGRLMFAGGLLILGLFMDLPYTATAFFAAGGPMLQGLPGIVIQIFLVPVIVAAIKRRRQ